jgi:hypothetical protein
MKTARDLVEFANERVTKIWKVCHEVLPMWHAVTADGEEFLVKQPCPDKDLAAAMIRALFELRNVVSYVYFAEAWILETKTADTTDAQLSDIISHGISNHPDRVDVVMFAAEDERGMVLARRSIVRPTDGVPTLSAIKYDDDLSRSEGRMVGMLPRRALHA